MKKKQKQICYHLQNNCKWCYFLSRNHNRKTDMRYKEVNKRKIEEEKKNSKIKMAKINQQKYNS